MIADIQTRADIRRADFIDRAVQIANSSGSREVMALADAALALKGEPAELFDALQYQLNALQRVLAIHGPGAVTERFNRIAVGLDASVRWPIAEPSCATCADTKATCAECCNASDACDCGRAIEVPCGECREVPRA